MIRKLAALLALVSSVALAAAPASAAPSSTGLLGGTGWRIAAEDSAFPGDPRVEFKVAAKFAPGNASGTYQFGNTDGTLITGEITCGSVDSGVAVVGGRITSANVPVIGNAFYIFFVDNGAPTFGSLGPDAVGLTQVLEPGEVLGGEFPPDFPYHCPPARGDVFAAEPLLTVLGNIVIH